MCQHYALKTPSSAALCRVSAFWGPFILLLHLSQLRAVSASQTWHSHRFLARLPASVCSNHIVEYL